jgi:hypothetical protein
MSQFHNYNGPLAGTNCGMLGIFHGFTRGSMLGVSASPNSGRPHR